MEVMPVVRPILVAISSMSFAACVVYDDDYHHHHAPPPAVYAEPAPAPVPPSEPAPAQPLRVEVDTGETMSADPGEGVGVFVEYASGGRWHIWWTCDTLQSGQSCDYFVSAAAQTGDVRNVDASELAGGDVTTPTASSVEARVTTTTEVHGIRFETDPGVVITLRASLGGLVDGSFLFFVQDGKVNGGYTGKLTNPLELQGKTP